MTRSWLVLTVLPMLAACAHTLGPSIEPEAIVEVATEDGWMLPLRRYPADGPPVLLVHGMGANHYNWDYRPENSLALVLQEHGWDVWVAELRGDPGSTAPSRRAARRFMFADHARLDLPVLVDAVLAQTGHEQLYWVGHSMGGMLLYTTLAQDPSPVAAGVAIASMGCIQERSALHRRFQRWSRLTPRWMLLRQKRAARASLVLGDANPLYDYLCNAENVEPALTRGLVRHAIIDQPGAMVREAVTWFDAGAFVDPQGQPWYAPADVPLLVLSGSVDRVAPPANVACSCELFPDCRYLELGRSTGFSTDYGHVDSIVGLTAKDEVYPIILEFLEGQRGASE